MRIFLIFLGINCSFDLLPCLHVIPSAWNCEPKTKRGVAVFPLFQVSDCSKRAIQVNEICCNYSGSQVESLLTVSLDGNCYLWMGILYINLMRLFVLQSNTSWNFCGFLLLRIGDVWHYYCVAGMTHDFGFDISA